MTNSSPSWYHAQGWTGAVTLQGGMQQPENPGNRDPQILGMMGPWERVAMALASTSALRSRGARFIPQLPGEDAAGYDAMTSKFVHVHWFEELIEMAVHKPNLFVIRPEQVVGFRTKRVAGRERLTQFRYLEMAQVEDGRYGSKWVERVRVLEPGKFELWEKADNRADSWTLI